MSSSRTVIFTVPLVFVAQVAWAIGGCPDYPKLPVGEAIAQYVSKNGNACAPGSYLKLGTTYDTDFVTVVYGGCERHYPPPSCPIYGNIEWRFIGASSITEAGVSGWTPVYPNPNTGPATLDTRSINTSTPDVPQWTFYTEGARQLRSASNIGINCGSPVTLVETTKTFNVVKCEPIFYNDNRHFDAAEIYIFLPANSLYSAGLDAAIADWNSKLTGTGVHLNRQTTSCSAGPHCVNAIVDTTIGACGWADPGGTDSNGVAQNPVLKINSNYTFSTAGLQRTFAHEIGHLLGMANYVIVTCGSNDAVMSDNFDCTTNPLANVATSDWLPVAKSVYGGGTKSKCGW